MNKESYLDALKEIELTALRNKKYLQKKYALENNKYKVGDIFEDHFGKIRIDLIGIYISNTNNFPMCYYEGVELKKNNEPKLSGAIRKAFQSNDISNNQS